MATSFSGTHTYNTYKMSKFFDWFFNEPTSRWQRVLEAPVKWVIAVSIFLGLCVGVTVAGVVIVPLAILKTALMLPG
jgi:hypothetical protein